MKRTHEIDLEQLLELIGIEIGDTAHEADARVVHQHVQPSESLDGAVHQPVDLDALGHIGGDHQGLFLTEFIHQRIERLDVTRRKHDIRSPSHEGACEGLSYAG